MPRTPVLLPFVLLLAACGGEGPRVVPGGASTPTTAGVPVRVSPAPVAPLPARPAAADRTPAVAATGPTPCPEGVDAPEAAEATPERAEVLRAQIAGLFAAATEGRDDEAQARSRALLLPAGTGFFEATFGPEVGARLAASYAPHRERIDTLPAVFLPLRAQGQTEIRVERFSDPEDAGATGYQGVALQAMRRPVALYSVRFVRPGATHGFHLWSFVHVDGAFRFAGKLRGVDAMARSPEADALGELRHREARQLFETGTITDD